MRYLITWIAIICGITICGITAGFAQTRGEIRGTVRDQQERAVAHAKVSYENLDDHRIQGALVRYAETDAEGKFTFDNLDWGRYAIYPQKEQDRYPDLRFAIYSGGTYQVATVSPAQPVASIAVKLGPKAAVLHGTIFSAIIGKSMSGRIELRNRQHPEQFIAMSVPPDYTVLVPAGTDVDVTFTAAGFLPYSIPLRMKSGEDLLFDVKLVPAPE